MNLLSNAVVARAGLFVIFAAMLGSPYIAAARTSGEEHALPDAPQAQPTLQEAQGPSTQTPAPAPQTSGTRKESVEPSDKKIDDPPKRMFGFIPDFENTNDTAEKRKPLTVREKYALAWQQSFDISAHIGDAFQAALQQAGNGQPHYGQGWGAFGERFAANEGDQITGSFLIYGVLPSVLHDDPRYFRKGTGSPAARIWYAVSRTFVTRRDNGSQRFNISQAAGQLMSCAISSTYYPDQDRDGGRIFSNWLVNLGGNSGYNVLSEYYPDLVKALFHRGKGANETR